MKKSAKKIDYVKRLKEELVDVDFDKEPKKVSLKELKEKAKRVRENYNYESSLRSRFNF